MILNIYVRSVFIALLLAACGGSGGGNSKGDKPVGDGNNVQKATARITVHGAAGDVTTDYAKGTP